MVAKVIPPDGKIFFVPAGREIHQEPGYDGLPLEDKKWLCFTNIFGTEDGFISQSDKIGDKEITQEKKIHFGNDSSLLLPMGTRIEAVTGQHLSGKER